MLLHVGHKNEPVSLAGTDCFFNSYILSFNKYPKATRSVSEMAKHILIRFHYLFYQKLLPVLWLHQVQRGVFHYQNIPCIIFCQTKHKAFYMYPGQ
jgi:hypothetical protein